MNDYKNMLMKVILVGDSGVGKTSLFYRYIRGQYQEDYKASVGVHFLCKRLYVNVEGGDRELLTLQIWDTAGQERFKTLTRAFFRGADAVVLVFDLCSRPTFESLDQWIDLTNEVITCPPIVLMGNKSDIDPENREVTDAEVRDWANFRGAIYHEVSAKSGDGVSDAFKSVARYGPHNKEPVLNYESVPRLVSIKRAEQTPIKKGSCCED
jgi:small GTP-binding protein